MKKLLLLLACFCAISLCAQDSSVWVLWQKGYESFTEAEQAKIGGNLNASLRHYRDARDAFNNIAKSNPDWNPKVVSDRIDMCNKQIRSILKSMMEEENSRRGSANLSRRIQAPLPRAYDTGNAAAKTTRRSVDDLTTGALSRQRQDVGSGGLSDAELKLYKEKLFRALIELDELRRKGSRDSKSADEVEKLLSEKFAIERKYNLLNQKYLALQKTSSSPDSALETVKGRLVEEKLVSEDLKRRLEAKNEQIKEYKKELSKLSDFRLATRNNRDKEASQAKDLYDKLARSDKLLSEQRENSRELAEKVASLNLEIASLNKNLKEKENQNNKLRKIAATIGDKKEGRDSIIARELANENYRVSKQIKETNELNAQLTKENAELKGRLRKVNVDLASISGRNKDMKGELTKIGYDYDTMKKAYDKNKSFADDLLKKYANIQKERNELKKELHTFADKYKKLKDSSDERLAKKYQDIVYEKQKLNRSLALKLADKTKQNIEQGKKYQELEKEKKQIDALLVQIKKDYKALRAEHKKLQVELQDKGKLADDLKNAQKHIEQLEDTKKEFRLAKARHQIFKEQYDKMLKQYNELSERSSKLEDAAKKHEELSKSFAELSKRHSQLAERNKEILKSNTMLISYRDKYNKLVKDYKQLSAKLDKTEQLATQNENAYRGQLNDLAKANAELKGKHSALTKEHKQLSSKLVELQAQQNKAGDEYKQKIRALSKANSELGSKHLALKKDYAALAAKLEKQPDDAEIKKLRSAAAALEKYSAHNKQLTTENSQLKQQIASLNSKLAATAAQKLNQTAAAPTAKTQKAPEQSKLPPETVKKPQPKVMRAAVSSTPAQTDIKTSKLDTLTFLRNAAAEAEKKGDVNTAKWYREQISKLSGPEINKLTSEALDSLTAGDIRGAEERAQRALNINSGNIDALLIQAAAALRRKDYDQALISYGGALTALKKTGAGNYRKPVVLAKIEAENLSELSRQNGENAVYAKKIIELINNCRLLCANDQ